nr:PepSY domain-containing protein [Sphingomonas sp. Mn802worker]
MSERTRTAAFHRAVWRWHFWAGLIVAPFLLMLSATGAIYLFNDELNDAIYPELRLVAPHTTSVPVSEMVRAALSAHPGAASRVDVPASNTRAAVVYVTPSDGVPLRVHVDPGSGRVLGSLVYERTLVGIADGLHGSLMIGTAGDRLVELAACWALVLLVTGTILWWPRGSGRWRKAGVLWPRFDLRGRRFWRALHGPVGVWSMGLIGFLIVTGLPWAGVSGDLLQRASAAAGVGYPPSFRTHNAPHSVSMKAALGQVPWTLEAAPMPQSNGGDQHQGHAGHEAPAATHDAAAIAGIDRVTRLLARRHLVGGYWLYLPAGPDGVYAAITYPDRPQGQHTIYVDRYSLRQIGQEVDYADYGIVGKAVELGVQLHMGNYFGRPNQLLMLVPCIAIWVLTISGVAMWWKRRPRGSTGAPSPIAGARARGLIIALVVAGLVLPLFGASLLLVAGLNLLLDRLLPAQRLA